MRSGAGAGKYGGEDDGDEERPTEGDADGDDRVMRELIEKYCAEPYLDTGSPSSPNFEEGIRSRPSLFGYGGDTTHAGVQPNAVQLEQAETALLIPNQME